MKIYKEIIDTEVVITISILIFAVIAMIIGILMACKFAKNKSEKEEKLKIFCEQECTINNEVDYECSNQCYDWYTKGIN